MARTTRRDMLGALGFTGLASIATAALAAPDRQPENSGESVHPDAELIALCDRVAVIERQWAASVDISGQLHFDDPEYQRLNEHESRLADRQVPMIEKIKTLPTHTMDGFRARARLIVLSDYGATETEDCHHGMVWSLLTALARGQADG